MASGELKTSTPLQLRCDSGYGNYPKGCIFGKAIELSPIRKKPSIRSVLKAYNDFSAGTAKFFHQTVDKVSKKLTFTSSDADSGIDSGIASISSESVESESLTEKLTASSTDENCNVLDSPDKNKIYQPYKYICAEGESGIDSGFASISSASVENESLFEKLTDFPTDENCNVLDSPDKNKKIYQPYKYICAEGESGIDSGFASISSASVENESLFEKLTDLPTDENCNVLDSPDKSKKNYQPYKYICAEGDSGIDSGFASISSASVENESLSEKLTDFPTDENCNVLDSPDKRNKFYQPCKYICGEGEKEYTELCQNELESSYQKISLYSLELLDDAVSIDATANSNQKVVKLDLLYELQIRNCTIILSQILSYLDPEELRIASYVSKDWQDIVFNDRDANNRRRIYINNKKNVAKGPNKENRFQTSSPVQRSHKSAFTSVINSENETLKPVIFNNFSGRFDSFLEVRKTIKDKQILQKCPKCHYPSSPESQNTFCCTRKLCLYEFCKKCSGPYSNNHLCSTLDLTTEDVPKIIIGSKKSKKNLRRL